MVPGRKLCCVLNPSHHTTLRHTRAALLSSTGDVSVSVEVVYHSAEYVLNAMLAAHRVCDQAEAAAATDGGGASALALLRQHETLLNQGLQFKWPTYPYSTLRSNAAHVQQQQQAGVYSSATAAAKVGSGNMRPQAATATAAAAFNENSPPELIAAIRSSLRLTSEQWQKLGCVETLQLPDVLADGQRCTYGAAIHNLLNRHVWVRTTGDDPDQWLSNRYVEC